MQERVVRELINNDFPEINIGHIRKIGEGMGNVAFEVNEDLIFRFPKDIENYEKLKKEIPILKIISQHASLSTPKLEFIGLNSRYIGYRKIDGEPLLFKRKTFGGWKDFYIKIGEFLSSIHSIQVQDFNGLDIDREQQSLESWLRDSLDLFNESKDLFPKEYIYQIESFFNTPPPISTWEERFCHNDLGIEHILVNNNVVSGVIDWGDSALSDPATDLGRIYRDLGTDALDGVLGTYLPPQKEDVRERAIFYGKCTLFDDMSVDRDKYPEYIKKSIEGLSFLFPLN